MGQSTPNDRQVNVRVEGLEQCLALGTPAGCYSSGGFAPSSAPLQAWTAPSLPTWPPLPVAARAPSLLPPSDEGTQSGLSHELITREKERLAQKTLFVSIVAKAVFFSASARAASDSSLARVRSFLSADNSSTSLFKDIGLSLLTPHLSEFLLEEGDGSGRGYRSQSHRIKVKDMTIEDSGVDLPLEDSFRVAI